MSSHPVCGHGCCGSPLQPPYQGHQSSYYLSSPQIHGKHPPLQGHPPQQPGYSYHQPPRPQYGYMQQISQQQYNQQQQQQFHHPPPPVALPTQQHGRPEQPSAPPQRPQHFGTGALHDYTFRHSRFKGRKKALLIGINYFNQRSQLQLCVNNVRHMTAYLVQQSGYRREDIAILTHDQRDQMSQPTKQNILRAMHWLVKGSQSSDSFFLYYSGPGGHSRDVNSDKSGGYEEVIYPVDFRLNGHITDDEMYRILVGSLSPGVTLTAILDSRHPGTVPVLTNIHSPHGVSRKPTLAKNIDQRGWPEPSQRVYVILASESQV